MDFRILGSYDFLFYGIKLLGIVDFRNLRNLELHTYII